MKEKKEIVIYGGSFNPPTETHLQIIEYLYKEKMFDKVLIIPCGNREDKPYLVDSKLRIKMLKLGIEDKV